jgi:hypothetical protein
MNIYVQKKFYIDQLSFEIRRNECSLSFNQREIEEIIFFVEDYHD